MEPMLHGQSRILDRDRQKLLALWAFKKATMLEFVYPQERAIQLSDAAWVYEHREPPPRAIVWIASYRGTARNSFYRHDVMQPQGTGPLADQVEREHDALTPPPVAYGANFGVRHVAFQVFGTTQESQLRSQTLGRPSVRQDLATAGRHHVASVDGIGRPHASASARAVRNG